jgi:diguanylate cyclase (GGDEF)-like protein/putative nucleotidyltransferase with HDIG domain
MFPSLAASMAIGVLLWDHFDRLSGLSVLLAAATLVVVVVRLAVSFKENWGLVEALRVDASTDELTGLANRRELLDDLESYLGGEALTPRVFALFDLDGFKTYNDSFGHPAGDALLRRLATSLGDSVTGHGRAYRLGGDEFCILARPGERGPGGIVAAASAALTIAGDGFSISASGGAVLLPDESTDASDALRTADNRMYAEKAERPGRVERHTRELLQRILSEREPELAEHQMDVAKLARAVARELSLDSEQADVVMRAAEFHDIGKIAIPDEILTKRGTLDEVEWGLIRTHTLIGERILSVSPAMVPVAKAVRSSHERWDGSGYPDRLAGEGIPIAARIVFVCDAYDAMRSRRAYSASFTHEGALAELRRNAGAQFDPVVVEAFCRVADEGFEAEIGTPATTLTQST